MTERITQQDKERVRRCKDARELLAEFGLRSWCYDPGVGAYNQQGNHLDFGGREWLWLKPLLEELREFRKVKRKGSRNYVPKRSYLR